MTTLDRRKALGALSAALLAQMAGAGFALAAEEEAPSLRLVTTHFPPYVLEQGAEAPGPLVRQASAVAAQAGFELQPEFVPWPRASGPFFASVDLPPVRTPAEISPVRA